MVEHVQSDGSNLAPHGIPMAPQSLMFSGPAMKPSAPATSGRGGGGAGAGPKKKPAGHPPSKKQEAMKQFEWTDELIKRYAYSSTSDALPPDHKPDMGPGTGDGNTQPHSPQSPRPPTPMTSRPSQQELQVHVSMGA
jgi:hypothetical protein